MTFHAKWVASRFSIKSRDPYFPSAISRAKSYFYMLGISLQLLVEELFFHALPHDNEEGGCGSIKIVK